MKDKDKDDNQKFLDKFKDQITTMGKNGILDTNKNNYNKFSANNNYNKIKSKGRKGSAFLKPINKIKAKDNSNDININNGVVEPKKNNEVINNTFNINNNDLNNNNNNFLNNPYILNNNDNISSILFENYTLMNKNFSFFLKEGA